MDTASCSSQACRSRTTRSATQWPRHTRWWFGRDERSVRRYQRRDVIEIRERRGQAAICGSTSSLLLAAIRTIGCLAMWGETVGGLMSVVGGCAVPRTMWWLGVVPGQAAASADRRTGIVASTPPHRGPRNIPPTRTHARAGTEAHRRRSRHREARPTRRQQMAALRVQSPAAVPEPVVAPMAPPLRRRMARRCQTPRIPARCSRRSRKRVLPRWRRR